MKRYMSLYVYSIITFRYSKYGFCLLYEEKIDNNKILYDYLEGTQRG